MASPMNNRIPISQYKPEYGAVLLYGEGWANPVVGILVASVFYPVLDDGDIAEDRWGEIDFLSQPNHFKHLTEESE